MVGYNWNILTMIGSVESTERPLVHFVGFSFCRASYFVGALAMTGNIGFGAGIAAFRLLYIKYPQLLLRTEVAMAKVSF